MIEITDLKIEARKLLDEVNHNFEMPHNGSWLFNPANTFERIAEEFSFKEKVRNLKQRINALQGHNIHVKSF